MWRASSAAAGMSALVIAKPTAMAIATARWTRGSAAFSSASPSLRQGSYFPPFLEPRKTSEKALVA